MAENNNRLNINQDHTRNDEEKALKLSEKEREKFKKELNDINELLEEELSNVMNDVPETTDTPSLYSYGYLITIHYRLNLVTKPTQK